MQSKKWIILCLCVMVLSSAGFFTWVRLGNPNMARPVALVNGVEITLKELQREIKKVRDMYAMQNNFPDEAALEKLKMEVLERLIERELLWQQAVRQGVVATDSDVSAEFEEMKKQYVNEDILNNMLKNKQITLEEFLELIKKDLTLKALIEHKFSNGITISNSACQNFYQNNINEFEAPEKIRASHIAIFVSEDAADAEKRTAEATMQTIAQRLKNGEAFEDMAREASQCASRERGGDLGFIVKGSMDPQFEEAAFALKPEEVSPVVKSSMGYHIIKVTEREPAGIIPFEEVRETIAQHLKEEQINSALKEYMTGLLKHADVKRLL